MSQRRVFLGLVFPALVGLVPTCELALAQSDHDLFARPTSQTASDSQDEPTSLGGNQPPLSEDMIASIAEQLGLPPDSPHIKRLLDTFEEARRADLSGRQSETVATTENIDDDQDPDSPTRHVVIRHFRGKEGVPFPQKDEIPLPFKVTQDDIKRVLEDHFAAVNKFVEQNTTPQKLPKCVENSTTKIETGFPDDDKRNQLISDMLFIDKKDVPLDPDEVFGKRTSLVSFDTQKENFETLPALGIGVDCLPYRFRVTRKYVFKDTGRNAFKNFDDDQFGPGKFSEYMKAKLGLKE